jgi:hypothetical protein
MNAQLAQKTVQFVQVGNVLVKRALDQVNDLQADRQKAASDREGILHKMAAVEAMQEGQEAQAAEMLSTHAGTTTLFKAALDRIAELSKKAAENQKTAGDLGQGVDQDVLSTGGAVSINDNYVGQRTSEKRGSDLALEAVLGPPA